MPPPYETAFAYYILTSGPAALMLSRNLEETKKLKFSTHPQTVRGRLPSRPLRVLPRRDSSFFIARHIPTLLALWHASSAGGGSGGEAAQRARAEEGREAPPPAASKP